eukprot:4679546-Pyramimonas_sp.AAC.1
MRRIMLVFLFHPTYWPWSYFRALSLSTSAIHSECVKTRTDEQVGAAAAGGVRAGACGVDPDERRVGVAAARVS